MFPRSDTLLLSLLLLAPLIVGLLALRDVVHGLLSMIVLALAAV